VKVKSPVTPILEEKISSATNIIRRISFEI